MTAPSDHLVLEERVKPALLNPPVKPVAPSGDLTWVLLCVGLSLDIFALAYTYCISQRHFFGGKQLRVL